MLGFSSIELNVDCSHDTPKHSQHCSNTSLGVQAEQLGECEYCRKMRNRIPLCEVCEVKVAGQGRRNEARQGNNTCVMKATRRRATDPDTSGTYPEATTTDQCNSPIEQTKRYESGLKELQHRLVLKRDS